MHTWLRGLATLLLVALCLGITACGSTHRPHSYTGHYGASNHHTHYPYHHGYQSYRHDYPTHVHDRGCGHAISYHYY